MEIERKFLVNGDFKQFSSKQTLIIQGYLSSVPERAVRVRISGDKGYITVKGISNDSGTTRFEWEKEIPLNEAESLLMLCEPGIINKTRWYIFDGDSHTFEVDEFHAENTGLILAEVELTSEVESFNKPEWLGKEVTGDIRYYNSTLMKTPFTSWENKL